MGVPAGEDDEEDEKKEEEEKRGEEGRRRKEGGGGEGGVWCVEHGSQNVFMCIVLFLDYVKKHQAGCWQLYNIADLTGLIEVGDGEGVGVGVGVGVSGGEKGGRSCYFLLLIHFFCYFF